MLALALILPMGVGIAAIFVVDKDKRPKGARAIANAVLKGYPYTLGLALTLFMIVEADDYLDVVAELQQALRRGGYETQRPRAGWMLRWPTQVFTFFAGTAADSLVAAQLVTLTSARIEVLLHPADLVIRGRETDVARVRAVISENLTFTKAYQTRTAEANKIEDRLTAIWDELKSTGRTQSRRCLEQLYAIERDSKGAALPFEEWEVLFRDRMVIERRLLRVLAGLSDASDEQQMGNSSRAQPTTRLEHSA
jgi:hypothetical protein